MREIKDGSYDHFECDLGKLKMLNNRLYAVALYAALCNMKWRYKKNEPITYSWRSAGGLVAELRDMNEDYLDFYCSGKEGQIHTQIMADLAKLNWHPVPWEGEQIETYNEFTDGDSPFDD